MRCPTALQVALPFALALTAGCAHAPAERPTAQPESSAANRAPVMLGCSGYTPPAHFLSPNRVSIRVQVQPNGDVLPGSARHLPSRWDRGGRSAVAQALPMAETCTFEPAVRGGERVASRATVRVAF